MLKTN